MMEAWRRRRRRLQAQYSLGTSGLQNPGPHICLRRTIRSFGQHTFISALQRGQSALKNEAEPRLTWQDA